MFFFYYIILRSQFGLVKFNSWRFVWEETFFQILVNDTKDI